MKQNHQKGALNFTNELDEALSIAEVVCIALLPAIYFYFYED